MNRQQSLGGGGARGFSPLKGFTLAEVLITLGIIGVVAAMTMPTLIGKYQKNAAATSLKRSYAVIAQTIERSKVDYGDVSGWRLDEIAGSSKNNEKEMIDIYVSQFWEPWVPKVKDVFYGTVKEFGYDKVDGVYVDNTKLKWYVLNDGSVVAIDIIVTSDLSKLSAVGYFGHKRLEKA